jgi:hypothetical protein
MTMTERIRGRFAPRRRADPAPSPQAVDAVEEELLAACRDADAAAEALSVALTARRAALVRLTARTALQGKGLCTRQFSPSMAWAALAAFDASEALGLPHVMANHRRSFTESALAVIDATAVHRQTPAPAEPALQKEIA